MGVTNHLLTGMILQVQIPNPVRGWQFTSLMTRCLRNKNAAVPTVRSSCRWLLPRPRVNVLGGAGGGARFDLNVVIKWFTSQPTPNKIIMFIKKRNHFNRKRLLSGPSIFVLRANYMSFWGSTQIHVTLSSMKGLFSYPGAASERWRNWTCGKYVSIPGAWLWHDIFVSSSWCQEAKVRCFWNHNFLR